MPLTTCSAADHDTPAVAGYLPQSEAWVFETAGVAWWAAEQVGQGKTRNISNGLNPNPCQANPEFRGGLVFEAHRLVYHPA